MLQPADLEQTVAGAVADAHAGIVTRWVIEVIQDDGSRALWCVAPEGQAQWDNLGLLRHATLTEEAEALVDDPELDEGTA